MGIRDAIANFLEKSSFQESFKIPFIGGAQYAYNLPVNNLMPINQNTSGLSLFGGGVGAGVVLLIGGFIAYKVMK